jgi:hypothetical protein
MRRSRPYEVGYWIKGCGNPENLFQKDIRIAEKITKTEYRDKNEVL